MYRITSYLQLYNEILKEFYIGTFTYGCKFMTQVEMQHKYQVSKSTIEKAYKMLKMANFIQTNGSNGTIVTFDRDNPKHLDSVPFFSPVSKNNRENIDFNTLNLPIIMLSTIIILGLQKITPQQKTEVMALHDEIIALIKSNLSHKHLSNKFLYTMVKNINNKYITTITKHFLERYIYFNDVTIVNSKIFNKIRACNLNFYTKQRDIIIEGNHTAIKSIFNDYYRELYQIPDLFLFSILDNTSDIFAEEALYGKLLYNILVTIFSNNLQVGDYLPTSKELCEQYGVSEKTVRRAYHILNEAGLISRKERIGTRLITNINDINIKEFINNTFFAEKLFIEDAVEAITIMTRDICEDMAPYLGQDLITKLEEEYYDKKQDYNKYGAHFFVSDILVSPIVFMLPDGIVSKYYLYVYNNINNLRIFFLAKFNQQFDNDKLIFDHIDQAITCLKQQNYAGFRHHTLTAIDYNSENITKIAQELFC